MHENELMRSYTGGGRKWGGGGDWRGKGLAGRDWERGGGGGVGKTIIKIAGSPWLW